MITYLHPYLFLLSYYNVCGCNSAIIVVPGTKLGFEMKLFIWGFAMFNEAMLLSYYVYCLFYIHLDMY